MKFILNILLFFLTVFATQTHAQNMNYDCYEKNIAKGKNAHLRGEFKNAINSFIYAGFCPEAKTDGEVDGLISSTLNFWVDSLEAVQDSVIKVAKIRDSLFNLVDRQKDNIKQELLRVDSLKRIADAERDTARLNLLLFNYSSIANQALKELQKPDSREGGLAKAFCALDTLLELQSGIPPIVNQAFGAAVFANYTRKLDHIHQGGIIDLKVLNSGQNFYAIGRDGTISLWEYQFDKLIKKILPTGMFTHLLKPENFADIFWVSADINPGQNELIAVDSRNKFSHSNISTGQSDSLHFSIGHEKRIIKLRVLNNGSFLSASRDGKVILWSENDQAKVIIKDDLPFVDLKLSDNGQYALARTMRSVYYWPVSQMKSVTKLIEKDKTALIYAAEISPTGQSVLVSNSNSEVILFVNGIAKNHIQFKGKVLGMKFPSTGNRFLLCSDLGEIQIWVKDYWAWKADLTFNIAADLMDVMGVNKNAKAFICSDADNNIRVFEYASRGEVFVKLNSHNKEITSMDFSPTENSEFLSSSKDGTVKLWKTSGELLMDLDFGKEMYGSAFLNNGTYILSVADSGELFVTPHPSYIYHRIKNGKIILPEVGSEIKKDIEQILDRQTQ